MTLAAFITLAFLVIGVGSARADLNPIQVENALPGTTAWVPHNQGSGRALDIYASEVSVLPGEAIHLHVSTNPVARYRIDVYRLGWYGGAGGRLIGCVPACGSDKQGVAYSVPPLDSNGFVDAGWPVTDTFTVPASAVSGYYWLTATLTSGSLAGGTHNFPLIVREPAAQHAPALAIAPVNTWQAYNDWGGKSTYSSPPAVKVSFNRPYSDMTPRYDLDLIRWLEREGYYVSYTTDVDVHFDPGSLLQHTLVMTVGHDEYWSKQERDGIGAARDSGVNLAFMGANTGYWQVRLDDGGRTLVEYRSATNDPSADPATKTVQFRDLVPPRPECELLGVQYDYGIVSSGDPPRDYTVNASALGDAWFAGSGFVSGDVVRDVVGYEWDKITPGCATPSLTRFFHYSGTPSDADAVRYTAPSGARVFAAGSLGFVYGLENFTGGSTTNSKLQQFMRNAMADLLTPAGPPPPAPVNSGLPLVSGLAQQGQVLSTTNGSWLNGPTSFGYQWLRCSAAGGSCVSIGGATGVSYTVQAADVGVTLRARVTAINAGGPGSAESTATPVVVAPPPVGGYRQQVLADGAVGYWRLGELSGVVAADETGRVAGSYVGGVTLAQPGALASDGNQAASFDGSNDYVLVPAASVLDLRVGVTIEVWVKRRLSGTWQVIVGKPGDGQSRFENYALWLDTSNQPIAYFGNGVTFVSVAAPAIDTGWHHVVATYDNAAARIYLDGVLKATATSTVALTANAGALNIGRAASNTYFYGGLLDELAVYSSALTAQQVQAHYSAATS